MLTSTFLAAAAALWVAGLALFVRADLTSQHKVVWVCVLVVAGILVGVVLSRPQVWNKFQLVMAMLPLVAAADLLLVRSKRTLVYWIRACGFEVVTVFIVAAVTRYGLDLIDINAIAQ